VSADSMDMTQEDHILYKNGVYKSFDKIKRYVQTRVDSSETVSDHIDAAYIDELLQDKDLKDKSRRQLNNIKELVSDNPKNKLDKNRLKVKNGFVVIDGFGLPVEGGEYQSYDDIREKNSKYFYLDAIRAWLNFSAALTGETVKTFDR
jgi:hypothetical protein